MSRLFRVRLLLLMTVIGGAGCSESASLPISDTLPAAGEAPRAIKRGTPKLDGAEVGTAAQSTQ